MPVKPKEECLFHNGQYTLYVSDEDLFTLSKKGPSRWGKPTWDTQWIMPIGDALYCAVFDHEGFNIWQPWHDDEPVMQEKECNYIVKLPDKLPATIAKYILKWSEDHGKDI